MSIKYFVSRPDGTRTSMITFAKAKDTVRDQAKKYAGEKERKMRLQVVGHKYGTWRDDLEATMDQWESLVKGEKPGNGVRLDIEDYPYTIGTRVILDEPPTRQTDGNSDIDKIYTWLTANENGRNGGICNRRPIAGSSTWSQHSPWPAPDPGANAVDWFSLPDTMDALYAASRRLAAAAQKEARTVPVGMMLVGSQEWSRGIGWHTSGAEYHRHLHIQGIRVRSGSPQGSC